MKRGCLVQTAYPDTLRMHRKDPYGRNYSNPTERYMNTFIFHPHEVGILLEESKVGVKSDSDEFEDLMLWKILTPSGVGYISTGWGTIPRYLKVIA